MKKERLSISGMKCNGCEGIIEDNLNNIKGIRVTADYMNNEINIEYDDSLVSLNMIEKRLNTLGYKIKRNDEKLDSVDFLKVILTILGVNIILSHTIGINIIGSVVSMVSSLVANVPTIDENTSLFLLFVIGILTSFHCVAMCGGINLSQCLTFENNGKVSANLQYNMGRVTSYTIIGGIVGAIGSVFSLSIQSQGFLYIVIGFFMIIMGLNLFGVPFVKKIIPRLPSKMKNINKTGKAPYIVGLLNGFMPCGPLQSMQLYALSTGSFIDGALSMFVFSIGTVPLMYLFGKIGELKNKNFMQNFMKISALLVLFLGISMSSRGFALVGVDFTQVKTAESSGLSGEIVDNEQVIYYDLDPRRYPNIVVQKDVPVKFIINATESSLNGCNNELIINQYGIQKRLEVGENIIEFTPTEVGTYRYSCWMGMIRASITVVE